MTLLEGSDCPKCIFHKHPKIGECPIYVAANYNEVCLRIVCCDNFRQFTQSHVIFTLRDLEMAERHTRGIIGHEDIVDRLQWLREKPLYDQTVTREELSDTERDLLEDYCRIKGELILDS